MMVLIVLLIALLIMLLLVVLLVVMRDSSWSRQFRLLVQRSIDTDSSIGTVGAMSGDVDSAGLKRPVDKLLL
jgi:hypothetical protein